MPSDVAIVRSAQTGRFNFVWQDNDVLFDETCLHEVMSRLTEARAKWWADSNGTHGSRLRTIKRISSSTKTDAEAYAREALQTMVDAKQITIRRVDVGVLSPGMGARFTVTVFFVAVGSDRELRAATTFA